VFQIPKTSTSDQVISCWATDGGLFSAPYNSPMKSKVQDFLNSNYKCTIDDPATEFFGMHFTRDRENRTADVTQPHFLSQCKNKYPLLTPSSTYPTCPMAYTKYLSPEDLANQKVLLNAKEITALQMLLGDCLWLTQHTRIDVKFPVNHFSRCTSPSPTLYDYLETLRVMHYMIGTASYARRIGGMHGAVLTATVDAAFMTHPDSKGHSSYTIHMGGGGGAVMADSKKQTITGTSSTDTELIALAKPFLPDLLWAQNFMFELDYDQRSAMPEGTPVGEDNTSTIKILQNDMNTGKIKHLNLRIATLREALADKKFQLFHLDTKDMVADIGTKPLAPGIFTHLSEYILGHKPLDAFLPFFKQHLLVTNHCSRTLSTIDRAAG
jgi:hypothetical protein